MEGGYRAHIDGRGEKMKCYLIDFFLGLAQIGGGLSAATQRCILRDV